MLKNNSNPGGYSRRLPFSASNVYKLLRFWLNLLGKLIFCLIYNVTVGDLKLHCN